MNDKVELAVFDMDGVLVDSHSSWVLVHRLYGSDNEDSLQAFMRGEIDDLEFIRLDVERWTSARGSVPLTEVEGVLDTAPLFPGALETLKTLGENGIRTAIVSGGLRYLADRIARMVDVDFVFANDVVVDPQGLLTGGGVVDVPLRHKGTVVSDIQEELGVGPEGTVAVGDTAVDVSMFSRARVTIAFNPKDPAIEGAATHVIRSRDLRSVLPLILGDGI